MSDNVQATPEQAEPQASSPDSGQGQETTQAEATFTQADVDRIVGERAKRASESAVNKLLESLGLSDVSEAKTLIESERKRKEAEMSDLEKAQAEIAKAQQQAQEALQAKAELEAQIVSNSRKQAFVRAVQSGGGSQVDDLYILVSAKHGSEFESVFDGSEADDKKMESFIKQVQSSFPSYFGTAGAGSPSNASGVAPNSQNIPEDVQQQLKRKFGKF